MSNGFTLTVSKYCLCALIASANYKNNVRGDRENFNQEGLFELVPNTIKNFFFLLFATLQPDMLCWCI
jgi:hypothetical protein